MDEAPGHIEMRRTVERNCRRLSMRSSRTANQYGTIHIGTGSMPRKTIRRVRKTSRRGLGNSAINLLMIVIISQHSSVVDDNFGYPRVGPKLREPVPLTATNKHDAHGIIGTDRVRFC
jgi:hypothetical protein